MVKQFDSAEVAKHADEKSCWLIIDNKETGTAEVFDVTKYLDDHPGGECGHAKHIAAPFFELITFFKSLQLSQITLY